MPRGQTRFRDLFAEELDAVVLPRSFGVETIKEIVRIGFAEKVWEKHSRPIARQ
jgi:hypothetical protein